MYNHVFNIFSIQEILTKSIQTLTSNRRLVGNQAKRVNSFSKGFVKWRDFSSALYIDSLNYSITKSTSPQTCGLYSLSEAKLHLQRPLIAIQIEDNV